MYHSRSQVDCRGAASLPKTHFRRKTGLLITISDKKNPIQGYIFFSFLQPLYSSFHTLPRRHQPLSGSLQPLSVTTFLVPSSQDPALSDPGGVATLGRRHR